MKITLAVVTARTTRETRFAEWCAVREALCNRKPYRTAFYRDGISTALDWPLPNDVVTGEFAALLTGVCTQSRHHLKQQLAAIALGTKQPTTCLLVDRSCAVETMPDVKYVRPIRLEDEPKGSRNRNRSMGCHDKNTAILFAPDDVLIMLDDCCLPSFGLVQAVSDYFEDEVHRDDVFMLGHQKVFLPKAEHGFACAIANWVDKPVQMPVSQAQATRRVCGIFAMRLETLLAVNGFNERLDGGRNGLDEELLVRLDRYLAANGGFYYYDPRARVYEIEHDMPWANVVADEKDWREHLPKEPDYRAPGPDLSQLRAFLYAIADTNYAVESVSLSKTMFNT